MGKDAFTQPAPCLLSSGLAPSLVDGASYTESGSPFGVLFGGSCNECDWYPPVSEDFKCKGLGTMFYLAESEFSNQQRRVNTPRNLVMEMWVQ